MVNNPETEVFLRTSSQQVSIKACLVTIHSLTLISAILRVEGAGLDAVSSPYLPWAAEMYTSIL